MKFYGVDVAEGSEISNASIAIGDTLPTTAPNTGELFYKTGASAGLYIYDGTVWVNVSLSTHNHDGTYTKPDDYATSTTGGTVKMRYDSGTGTLYITNDGTDA